MSVLIGPMVADDAQRCAELECALFDGDDPWSPEAFLEALAAGHHYLSAREGSSLIGYVGLARVGGEAEVHTLAVDPAHQRRGIGRALLRAILDHAQGATVFLEVRTDNDSAIRAVSQRRVRCDRYAAAVTTAQRSRRVHHAPAGLP